MPINAADARQLSRVILLAYFEDVQKAAMLLKPLRTEFPAINWIAELTTVVSGWQPFIDSGLDRNWYINEIDRMSQPGA